MSRSGGESIFRSAGWALGGKLTSAGAGIVISVLVTRMLDPDRVGVYFILASIVTMAALVCRFGLDKGILQLVARTPESIGRGIPRPAIGRASQVVMAIWAVTALLVLALGRPVIGLLTPMPITTPILALLVAWIGGLAFEQLFSESFRAAGFIPEASTFGGALSRTLTVIGLLAVWLSVRPVTIELVLLVAVSTMMIAVAASGVSLYRRLESVDGASVSWSGAFGLGLPLLISNAVLYVAGTADLWILGAFRSDPEVALYGAAVRLVTIVALFLGIANAILPPMVAQLRFEPVRLERRVRLISTCAALPAGALLLVLIGGSTSILVLLFGEFYRAAAFALVILCVGQFANVAVGSCGYVLVVTGHQRDLMLTALGAGVVTIAGSAFLAPEFGIEGVAAAVGVGTVCHQVSMLLLARYRTGLWTHVGRRYARLAYRRVRRGWRTSRAAR